MSSSNPRCSNAFTPVNALKLDDVHVEFFGNVHLPQDIPYVQNIVANSTDFSGHWFRFTGKKLKWYGVKEDVSVSWIECMYAASLPFPF